MSIRLCKSVKQSDTAHLQGVNQGMYVFVSGMPFIVGTRMDVYLLKEGVRGM